MSATTFVVNQNLTTEVCYKCGVLFAMPESWRKTFLETHQDFYCPAGHAQHYIGLSEVERLQGQLEKEQQATKHAWKRRDEALAEADHFRKSRDGMKGALRKVCIRVKNGVCPCCKRTFSCLADHMKTKHPDYPVPTP